MLRAEAPEKAKCEVEAEPENVATPKGAGNVTLPWTVRPADTSSSAESGFVVKAVRSHVDAAPQGRKFRVGVCSVCCAGR